jgi:hypothetical protein
VKKNIDGVTPRLPQTVENCFSNPSFNSFPKRGAQNQIVNRVVL